MLAEELEHLRAHVEDLLRDDLNVGRCALRRSARWLVHHDAGVRQRAALPLPSRREQETPHARGHAHADRAHRRREMLHRVVDGEPARDVAAGRVDVQLDVLPGSIGLEKEQLRDDDVRDVVIDRRAEENDPVHEQT